MNRRTITAVVVGLLVLVTAALVILALRPSAPPRSTEVPLDVGAIAVSGDRAWRWSGPSECNADTDILPIERRIGNGAWLGTSIPLVGVTGLAFNDADQGIAIGSTRQCARGIALTVDGGVKWHYRSDNPVLLDAWWSGSRLWGIERGSGLPQLKAYEVGGKYKLSPLRQVTPVMPCDAADGTASHVAFYTANLGLLLCEQQASDNRLLARTTTAGNAFEALSDGRPASGMDGAGPIVDLDIAGTNSAWLQFPAGEECTEGQLRSSTSQGGVWKRLPCPAKSTPIDLVLDVAFTSPKDGVMLATRNDVAVMLETQDAGQTWKVQ